MKKVRNSLLVISSLSLVSTVALSSFLVTGDFKEIELTFDPYVCFIGDTFYTSIEQALKESKPNDVVEVIVGNKNRNSKPFTITTENPSKEVIIPEGVTLFIPYAKGATNSKSANITSDINALNNRGAYCKSSVILDDGITLINNGTLEIGGILSAAGGAKPNGRIGGEYSELILGENSVLKNHGTLNIYGYIGEKVKDKSLIELIPNESGTIPKLSMPMTWYDFGGGSALKAIYDAIETRYCLPLDDFFFESVEPITKIYSGSEVVSWVNLYASDQYAEYDLKLIGDDANSIINLNNSSYLYSNFDGGSLHHFLDFYGSTNFNDLTIDVEKAVKDVMGEGARALASLILPSKVTSSEGYFPLSYHYQVTLNANENKKAIFDASNSRYKLMNGSSLFLDKNSTLNVKEMIVYKGDDIYSKRDGHASSLSKSRKSLDPAKAIINGKLIGDKISGTFTTAEKNSEITAKIATDLTMYEPKNGTGGTFSAKMLENEEGRFYLDFNLMLKDVNNEFVKRDPGRYISNASEHTYWEKVQNKEIQAVQIINNESTASTEAGKSKTFNLSAKIYPENYENEIISYKWSVTKNSGPGGEATLSNYNQATTSLTIPANSDEETDTYYDVKLTLEYKSLEDEEIYEVSNSMRFTALKKKTGCFEKGTLIKTMRGNIPIEELRKTDVVVTWNFLEGKFEEQGIAIVVDHGLNRYNVIELQFDNGQTLGVIQDHGLFDYDLNKFVYIYYDNYREFIGHNFAFNNNGVIETAKLIEVNVVSKTTHAYSITSTGNYNVFANDVLTLPPPEPLYNWMPMGEKLRYDVAQFEQDVKKYGLYDYSVFEPYGISYEVFIAFNGPYLKIPVEKGIFTFDYIIEQFNLYREFLE